jgi:hypothetical protein
MTTTTMSYVAGMDSSGFPTLYKRMGTSGDWEVEHAFGAALGSPFLEVYAFDADNIAAVGDKCISVKQAGSWIDDSYVVSDLAFNGVYMPTAARVLVCGRNTADGFGRVWEWGGVGVMAESLVVAEWSCTTIHGIGATNIWVGTHAQFE